MKKKVLGMILAASMAAGALTGCGSDYCADPAVKKLISVGNISGV